MGVVHCLTCSDLLLSLSPLDPIHHTTYPLGTTHQYHDRCAAQAPDKEYSDLAIASAERLVLVTRSVLVLHCTRTALVPHSYCTVLVLHPYRTDTALVLHSYYCVTQVRCWWDVSVAAYEQVQILTPHPLHTYSTPILHPSHSTLTPHSLHTQSTLFSTLLSPLPPPPPSS
jgi:hypothetical protein